MIATRLLFADIGDWISVLIPFVVMIIWVLNQVFSKLAQPGPQRPEMRRPNVPPRPVQDPRVNEEIEKFLRRAAQQQQAAAREAKPSAPFASTPARTLARRPDIFGTPAKTPLPSAPLVEVEMIDESAAADKSVGDHVEQYFQKSQFKNRPEQLSKVDQADEQMDARVHEVFDRQLGTLAGATSSNAAAASMMAKPNQLAGLLRDPRSLRNAIILQEILAPPEARWKD
jgi:hypothetical protein